MSERYKRLFALPKHLYAEGSPLLIEAGALLKDSQTGRILAQIKFKSISPKIIKAVKISVGAFDISGVKLRGIDEYQYLDLSASRDSEFGQKNAVELPESITRSFSCECKSVVFYDGTTWESKGAEWKPLAQAQTLKEKLGALCEQYRRDTVNYADLVVTDDRDLWICTCGAINKKDEKCCHSCHVNKKILTDALDVKKLEENEAAFKKAEAERKKAEAERKAEIERQELKKKKRNKKIAIITTPIVCVCIAFLIILTTVIIPNGKYNVAVSLMNDKKYDEAITAFEMLNGYKDSENQIENCYIGKYGEEKWNKIKSIENIKNAKIGDNCIFGKYEQDNEIFNGEEAIDWIVLDKYENSVLLISKSVLDWRPYNSESKATWENCSLRMWLNDTFFNKAFNTEEQVQILNTEDTGFVDKVFLLSINEMKKYFNLSTHLDRRCELTAYAANLPGVNDSDYCDWWLRSLTDSPFGDLFDTAARVLADGSLSGLVVSGDCGIRPAIWVDLNY